MNLTLTIAPSGKPLLSEPEGSTPQAPGNSRMRAALDAGIGPWLLYLATDELSASFPAEFVFAREVAQRYINRLCRIPELDELPELPPPSIDAHDLTELVLEAPPFPGAEYLSPEVLADWTRELDQHLRAEIASTGKKIGEYLREKNPVWRLVGRVTVHLAENKRDEEKPFAFLATYANRISRKGSVQHLPLSKALEQYAHAKDREALVALLTPLQRAGEACPWVQNLIETGGIYRPLAWTPSQAHRFLQDIPKLEASGLVVRVPDWWHVKKPPRPQVNVTIGNAAKSSLNADTLLDFSFAVAVNGQPLTDKEWKELQSATSGLVRLRGEWIEVDREKLQAALDHWETIRREARHGGIGFFEGMRLLAGTPQESEQETATEDAVREWSGIEPGEWLRETLDALRSPQAATPPPTLNATLRPYQQVGFQWLQFVSRLGLGACLADDMGLGKTIQILSLLLAKKEQSTPSHPSLLVVPASLIANWKGEIARFAPTLRVWVAHPSEGDRGKIPATVDSKITGVDLVITTYGMVCRQDAIRKAQWNLVILDEAQAIKNSGTRQTKAVKQLHAESRIALSGTPIENRLSDLWSLFDFLNPGLLGTAKQFSKYVGSMKERDGGSFAPLKALVKPYILRRLKTDKRIIADLPEKTEQQAFCSLTKIQAAIYQRVVEQLESRLKEVEGIQRRGIVLTTLMQLKQICNHPSQWKGEDTYASEESGKFQRLVEICEELAARQDKVLVFTQFREITEPLAEVLRTVFSRPGLILHGGTPVKKRRELVETFQRDDGAPFFILSLKAGGTGLNLTAASHVIHFDRWWNPAVENQATDRAFRIGQQRNVMVHKFVCRGTVEERIDKLIAEKVGLATDVLDDGGAERMLTEMSDRELLDFVAIDVAGALAE